MTPSAIATARWWGISSAVSSGSVSELACGRMPAHHLVAEVE
jgi:hypothetical protein